MKIIYFEERDSLKMSTLFSFKQLKRLDKISNQNLFSIFEANNIDDKNLFLLVCIKKQENINSKNIEQIFNFIKSEYEVPKEIIYIRENSKSNELINYFLLVKTFQIWSNSDFKFRVGKFRKINENFVMKIDRLKTINRNFLFEYLKNNLVIENDKFQMCLLLAHILKINEWNFFLYYLFLSLMKRTEKKINVIDLKSISNLEENKDLKKTTEKLLSIYKSGASSNPFVSSNVKLKNSLNLTVEETKVFYELKKNKRKEISFFKENEKTLELENAILLFARLYPRYISEFWKMINFAEKEKMLIVNKNRIILTRRTKLIYNCLKGNKIEKLIEEF